MDVPQHDPSWELVRLPHNRNKGLVVLTLKLYIIGLDPLLLFSNGYTSKPSDFST